MKIKYQVIGILGVVITLLTPHIVVIAQEDYLVFPGEELLNKDQTTTQLNQEELQSTGIKTEELGNCFDTYKFGSLNINVTPDSSEYNPGDVIVIKGKITNTNNYPLIGVTVAARVLKDIPNANGQAYTTTIEEFILAENITLDAKASIDINESYNIPIKAAKGDYQIYLFGYQENRFNLAGLSFTDDIYGSRFSFKVKGENTQSIYLDQTRTTVGGQKHINHGYITKHNYNNPIEVKIPLKNTTNQEQKVILESTLYKWDGLQKENIEKSNTREIKIPAKGEIEVTEIVDKPDTSVYYLKLKANIAEIPNVQKQQSISNIRFLVEDLNRVRLNWIGFDTFPKAAGQDAKIVTCIHNTNDGIAKDISVETKIIDKWGKEMAKSSYKGDMGGAISGIIADLPKDKIINQALITSVVKDNEGKVIDTLNITYDCKKIGDGSKCIKEPIGSIIMRNSMGIIGGILVLGLIIYSIILQKKSIKRIVNRKKI